MTLVETETIFGRMVTGWDVEQWVLAFLRRWSGTYLSELERQHGYEAGGFQRIRGWVLAPDFNKFPEDQVPAVLVVSPGLVPPPQKDGAGVYRARWTIRIGCLCSARTQQRSHELATLYVAAHVNAILQHPSLEGHAAGVSWLDLSYDELDFNDTRTLYAGYATLAVEVEDVVSSQAGPATPDDPLDPDTLPWPPYQVVETHHEDVRHTPAPDPIPPLEGGS